MRVLSEKQNVYNDLSSEEKTKVKKFYNAKIQQLDKCQKLICREASVQVVLQLTLLLYQEILINRYLLTDTGHPLVFKF